MRRLTVLFIAAALVIGSVGCTSGSGRDTAPPTRPDAPKVPAQPDRSTPITAVESYTDWISYAYRVAQSSVATHAFSLYEEVRVDSYIQMNRNENKQAIDQHIVDADYRLVSKEETRATVSGSEDWWYRYIDIETGKYKGPEHTASYDVTYTVVIEPRDNWSGWLVDKVDVTARGDVP